MNMSGVLLHTKIVCKIPTLYQKIKIRDDRVQWGQAINDEISPFLINNTWILIPKRTKIL